MQPAHGEFNAVHIAPVAEPALSFYLLEESWPIIGETGYFRAYATTDELHARLEPKLAHYESFGRLLNDLLLGESVNVWTVQRGRLAAGLDVTEFVNVQLPNGATTVFELIRHQIDRNSGKRADPPPAHEGAPLFLDWDGIIARLPPLEAPVASPGDKNLAVRLDGPHPAPDIWSYLDGMMTALVDEERFEWAPNLDYGTPYIC